AALRDRARGLGRESSVEYGGRSIAVDKPADRQPIFNALYDFTENKANRDTTPPEEAMARPTVDAHLEGTTLFRPGLGNLSPSASTLFRLAQYCDKLVLTYECTDGTGASKLRPLTEYKGMPVPDSLRGQLFAIGTP